jgi:ATP-dependent exoDNAse (exonuclease V) beta subunit
MNVNSCTGMEAGMVFVLGIGCLLNKAKNIELQAEEQQQMQHESIRKLYVAMTRAGQKLVLFSTENLPEEMNDLIDKA